MDRETTGAAIVIRRERPDDGDVRHLTAALDAELNRLYPEEGANFLRLDSAETEEGRGTFLVARSGGEALGCGAVRLRDAHTAEIKRMYVKPGLRGRGVGARILGALEAEARKLGARRIVLEAGDRQPEALALYARAGFARIACFDEYAGAPLSVCMAKDA